MGGSIELRDGNLNEEYESMDCERVSERKVVSLMKAEGW